MNLDPDQLEALATSVSEGTFDAAARTLHVTPSAISQRIKALESAVGRALVIRSKPVRPTSSGEIVLRAARQLQAIAADLEAELGDRPGGDDGAAGSPPVVAIAANADSLGTWLLPALSRIETPIVFDIFRDDEGRTAEFLRQGEVMAAVTASSAPIPGCTVTRLGDMWYRPKATPAFVQRWFSAGVSSSALARAPVVRFDRHDDLQDRYLRRRGHRPLHPPGHYVPGSNAFYEAVRLGLGWAMIPDLQDQPEASGLVDFDPQ
ncbi:MAG TPA: LysR family transcriptional regulator ArgP, partial [Solirubrobacteraceae bacterium]|nr:LysR family transcriptional regulator ArgP [Solirubrobacteraceae bacterium]